MRLPMVSDWTTHEADLRQLILGWEPSKRPVHCSNCLHAKVHGDSHGPEVYCALGFGKPMPLWTLIRAHSPRQFEPASRCPDFASMDAVS